MSKFLFCKRFSAATVATVATFFKKQVATLFPQGSNTGSNTHGTLHWLVSHLKTPFNSLLGSNSSNTFPNFAQENCDLREGNENPPVIHEFPDSHDLGDEYDLSDFEGYLSEEELYDTVSDEEYENRSWQQRAVDEAIDEEEPGAYPPGDVGDIPW